MTDEVQIESVSVWRPEPGDVLLVTTSPGFLMSAQEADRIKHALRAKLPLGVDVEIVVLDGIQLDVVRPGT